MTGTDPFAPAQAIADAVLYEGHILYPYRASAVKNRMRWQWGVVGPAGAHAAGMGEPSTAGTSFLVERAGDTDATLLVRVRFLRITRQRIERLDDADIDLHSATAEVEEVRIGDELHVAFDEADEESIDLSLPLTVDSTAVAVTRSYGREERATALGEADGRLHQLVRTQHEVRAKVRATGEPISPSLHRVSVDVQNTAEWAGRDRDDASAASLIGVHAMGAVRDGLVLSAIDPPPHALAPTALLGRDRLWPVLIGGEQRAPLVLAAPVILYDQPEIAPESSGEFFDGLEMDEMLHHRVMTLTPKEKAEARATDPRAAAIIDRVEATTDADVGALHGAIRPVDDAGEMRPSRVAADNVTFPTIVGDGVGDPGASGTDLTGGTPWWDPAVDEGFNPDTDGVNVGGRLIRRGSNVTLHPTRRADAHDMFLIGREATVAAVLHDVDGSVHLAVTINDDPAADLYDATGRYRYFTPDEVRPADRRPE